MICGCLNAGWSGIERAVTLSILEQQLDTRPAKGWFLASLSVGACFFLLQLNSTLFDMEKKSFMFGNVMIPQMVFWMFSVLIGKFERKLKNNLICKIQPI